MLRSTALAAAPARHPLLLLRRPSLVSGGRQASLSLAPRFPPAQTHGGGHGSAAQPSWVAAAKKEGKAPGRRGSKQAPSPAQKPAAAVQDPRSEELCLACEQGDLERAKELLSACANYHACNKAGHFALSLAARGGHLAVVRELLERGAHVDRPPGSRGFTALRAAAGRKGNVEVLRELLRRGAQVDMAASSGSDPDKEEQDGDGDDADDAFLKLLLRDGNTGRPEAGTTPLMAACLCSDVEMVRLLLDPGGASPHAKNQQDGATPLYVAALFGRLDTAKLLLSHGADPEVKDNEDSIRNKYDDDFWKQAKFLDGRRPLHYVAAEGRAEVVKVLAAVDKGINKADNEGDTPLYLAAREGHEEAARALLEAGANPQQGNQYGMTALEVAPKGSAVAQLLTQHMQKATQKQKDDKKQKQQKRKP
ncbi:hypothetical protein HYH03_013848 [Edaphochlamys debaryana]|uniref:Uncharacterized protein n=1 Tax=Edaphochlamys debaryana TaxID=47281 RepID=A0A836BU59_9CHLO|nr:hypothetical protein HYH03_013848 [Edaphochlamys debaryana]|eukprot:KAG2487569.1 hypothetical protein HYH03_013848 [Edaphochlamys debaryana]